MNATADSFDAKTFLGNLTTRPGVYRMFAADGSLLYVGKARNLKKRVSTYFLRASGNPRIESMVSQIRHIEVTVTHTEDEALLLECTLIKELEPRYNISLRDDKSYPYVRFSDHEFPRITLYRGAKLGKDRYFGPFPSVQSVRETLLSLQKLFGLRPCTDTYFANRQRPCLQYQIGRCSAPCVGLVDRAGYAAEVAKAASLLEGHANELITELSSGMEQASKALEFEHAARLRDQIAALQRVRDHRNLTGGASEMDVIAVAPHETSTAVAVISVRDGLNLGHASFFPRHPPGTTPGALLSAFIGQYYLQRLPPREIVVSVVPHNRPWLEATLGERAGRILHITKPERGAKRRLLQMAEQTAAQLLTQHLAAAVDMATRLRGLAELLDLPARPERMECFDISHTRGERPVASCVVFNNEGPLRSAYRRFNIATTETPEAERRTDTEVLRNEAPITPGDDYAAIHQAVKRRYARVQSGEVPMPDILFIDGGQGQLEKACEALDELALVPRPAVVGVAKGPTRRPGLEQLIVAGRGQPIMLPADSPVLHLIQHIRDESHRFAITGHRGRRKKARTESSLETIEGLGPVRRRALLKTLGGLQQVRRAGVDELASVPGIQRHLAERIYAYFH
ncbi:MAG TPA: excinuclease ABC subunit UvrC [Nevskiaceae bacterium]|nr:excinuclease ABC subunit UvrC [Nevskiaceae bacterium]